ncbi:MAG TPA: peptidyl-prolyl cis-trans isomerase [Elusimicrobia bacterium]|nr:peptidyl-prolyl cis-trans isomerase [Elusimicrobiota bacterium]HBT62039.1 peptidyl-prolyl cis-trans isomerase [Elusimicrobiota bacterium]
MKTATIVTSRGSINIKLFDKDCPKTVANFEKLANSKFYDGQKWHRVIKDFMIQGGDPLSRAGGPRVGTGGPGYQTDCEIRPHLKHAKGALSMAHAGTCEHDPSGEKLQGECSNGSQFFITHRATPHLDGVHTVFGQVASGQDVVDAIRQNDEIVSIRVEGK